MYVYSKQFVDRLRPETGAFRLCPRFGYREIAYGVLPAEQSYVHRVSGAYQIQKWPTHPNNNPLGPPRGSCDVMSFHVISCTSAMGARKAGDSGVRGSQRNHSWGSPGRFRRETREMFDMLNPHSSFRPISGEVSIFHSWIPSRFACFFASPFSAG